MLLVLVLIAHDRRRIVHVHVTEHATSEWTAQQLIEAFPEDSAPRYLLRDRDSIYDDQMRRSDRAIRDTTPLRSLNFVCTSGVRRRVPARARCIRSLAVVWVWS